MTKQPKKFAWIVEELAKRGLQQKDLAQKWGVTDAVVTRFIADGTSRLTPDRMRVLARTFDMDYNELMERIQETVPKRRLAVFPPRVEPAKPRKPEPAVKNGTPNESPELRELMQEIYEVAERVRQIMPGMEVNVTFSCRGK